MTAWRALAGAATVGQGRSREAVARLRDSLEGLALVRPLRDKRSCLHLCKICADGVRIVEMLDVLSRTYGKGVSAEAQNLEAPQPHAPGRRRRFYLAVQIKHSTPTLHDDISLRRNRSSHVSAYAIPPHADCSPLHRSTAAELSCARCKQCARRATRMTSGRHCVGRPPHDLLI